ncbi:hypothetical protein GW17_00042764 [Ensete ventricosum]|nr:hypothetical protein GW17_00042764 [Ensete ventricosum]
MSQESLQPNNLSEHLEEDVSAAQQAPGAGGQTLFPPLEEGNPSMLTLGHYWRLFNDPRLSPLALNPRLPTISTKAFLGLTNQVQALNGMIQTIIPHIPQLAQQFRLGVPGDRLAHNSMTSTPSLHKPDTLSSNSANSLRA